MAQQKAHAFNLSSPDLVSAYDEIPLWSAPFGLKLLEKVRLKPGMTVLDIGCGTGFPLLELAQRLGDTCRIYGIDPWSAALDRLRLKMRQYEVHNVQLFNEAAENMSFADGLFDLVVSNVGFNNVSDQGKVFRSCAKACKHGAQLILTVNLPDTMKLFYEVFESVLRDTGKDDEVRVMRAHVHEKRRPLEELTLLIEEAGFMISEIIEDSFRMRFLNGTCLFNHYFIRLAFMESWRNILTPTDRDPVFELVEQRLNDVAAHGGELSLSIPYVCIIGEKP